MSDGVPFELSIDGVPSSQLHVVAIRGEEQMSKAWRFDVTLTAQLGEDLEVAALGQRASLVIDVGERQRAFYGVIASVRLAEVHEIDQRIKYVSPRAAALAAQAPDAIARLPEHARAGHRVGCTARGGHRDALAAHAALSDARKSSCWIRVMQPWAGAAWGHQFIPRVGMEVVVAFEGGDPDKPMVLGSVPNGTHPTPFKLPGDKTRSGIRTQSTPGGAGFNELSFQDATGSEQIYFHAQRNLDEIIEKNHTLLVRKDEFIRVLGSRIDTIEKNLNETVRGDASSQVDGNRLDVVTGNRDNRVSGMLVTRVEGRERRDVTKMTDLNYGDDVTTRVKGCVTTIVGTATAKRSWQAHAEGVARLTSSESTEVSSEKELTLRVGKSSIRITSDKIEIQSGAVTAKGQGGGLSADDDGLKLSSTKDAQLLVDHKIVIQSKDGSSLSMQKEVKVDGSQILLNSPDQAQDPPPKPADPPTKIAFKDDGGKPLAYQRFLITMADGSAVSGMTDKDGNAEMDLKSGGKVTFPDLPKAK